MSDNQSSQISEVRISEVPLYIQVKKKAFKINAKIEDVGLNEDLKSTETRNGH